MAPARRRRTAPCPFRPAGKAGEGGTEDTDPRSGGGMCPPNSDGVGRRGNPRSRVDENDDTEVRAVWFYLTYDLAKN